MKSGERAGKASFENLEGHQLNSFILIINSIILVYLFMFLLLYMRYFLISYKYIFKYLHIMKNIRLASDICHTKQ